jgi:general secretion pathway protein N
MRPRKCHLAIAAALALGTVEARGANPPGALDQPPSNLLPGAVDMTRTGPAENTEKPMDPTGNPLWAVPLSSLTATRERPLFTPSRRAPAPAVAGPVAVVAPPPAAPPPPEPERPSLILVGAIAGETEGFAVFLDQATNNIVRLKTGQDHDGWVLLSVKGREATLEKDKRSATLALPAPGGPGGPGPLGEEGLGSPQLPPGSAQLPAAVPLPGGGLGIPRRPEPE